MRVRIKNWSEYQHYKDRNPPWVKLHCDLLTGETWAMASDKDRLIMLVSMMVGSRGKNHGEIPSEEYMQRVAYLAQKPNFKRLVDLGFFEEVKDDIDLLADASAVQAECTPSVSVSPSDSPYPFDAAWELYGKKGSKNAASTYWAKISDFDRAAIMKAIPEYLKVCEAGRMKSDMSGWLNPRNRKWDQDWGAELREWTKDRKPATKPNHNQTSQEMDPSKY